MANSSVNLGEINLESVEGQTWNIFNKCFDDSNSPGNLLDNDVQTSSSSSSSSSKKSATNGMINKSSKSDTMKLKQEDMYLYGHCPEWEQFYLVVCEYCGKVIKPQALAKHIELRHNTAQNTSETSSNRRSEALSSSPKANNNHCVQNNRNVNQNKTFGNNLTAKASSTTSSSSLKSLPELSASSTALIEDSLSKNNNGPRLKLTIPTPPGPGPGGGVGLDINSCKSDVNKKSSIVQSEVKNYSSKSSSNSSLTTLSSSSSSIKKVSKEKLLPCKDREYDANKHCGVRISDSEKPCTRSLTCKTHSLTLRRAVIGRCKNFDILLSEHKAAKDAKLRALGIKPKLTKQQIKQKEQEARRIQQLDKQQQQQQQKQQQQQQQQQLQQQQQTQQNSQEETNSVQQNEKFLHKYPQLPTPIQRKSEDNLKQPIINLQRITKPIAKEKKLYKNRNLNKSIIGKDGGLYLPVHPKPQALCTFNGRYLSLSSHNITLVAYDRRKQLLISSLDQFFKRKESIDLKKANNTNGNKNKNLNTFTASTASLSSLLRSPAQQPFKKIKLENANEIGNSNSGNKLILSSALSTSNSNLASTGPTSLLSQSHVKTKSFKKKCKLTSLNNGDIDCLSPSSSLSSLSSPPTPVNKSGLHKVSNSSSSSLVSSPISNVPLNELLSQPNDNISKSLLVNGYHFSNNTFQSRKGNIRKNSTNTLMRLPSSLSFTSPTPSVTQSSSPTLIAATSSSSPSSNSAQHIQQLQAKSVLKSKQHSRINVAPKTGSLKFLQN